MDNWNPTDLSDLSGRTVVVTGGNAGLGYFACEQLAAAGASVVMASRNEQKARAAIAAIRHQVPEARVEFQELDLARLDSVRRAVDLLSARGPIDALLANAGVVGAAGRQQTADGFELQFGTNHLGHFALTAGLLPALTAARGRVVHLGSISHRWVRLDTADLMPARYNNPRAYATSKLAVMTFGFELAARLHLLGSPVQSIVAHPGLALDMLTPQRPGIGLNNTSPAPQRRILAPVSHGKDTGAWPLVRAVADAAVGNGSYCGPQGWFQLRGNPALVPAQSHARERNTASRLIDASQELTGVQLSL
ncbi:MULTISPECIES: SDR family NAD(P)-dependent oxidoreductase [unclassified Arthrobacter]|uniref:SDR family NAD(P)-dependent oxidoreductase n=1 Tax=unclassified Arthrobacter TaxID=235627 RepID=UPI0014910468|nr:MULTISPECIES: SDR family NAD(P)-dependent oxidoreductase [unclassified Arthrobacter]MBE0010469.1 SDR family NAD(P)-dependent oxidoreductase [Arthrobacter sp. AET 35A]NOJ62371.1 SDR family NAD(P)-dependent oxidoreductase [Arthrobacter sp. 147(2020)]